jgi:hypothetical protein
LGKKIPLNYTRTLVPVPFSFHTKILLHSYFSCGRESVRELFYEDIYLVGITATAGRDTSSCNYSRCIPANTAICHLALFARFTPTAVYLSIHLCFLSIYLSFHLSIYLSIHLSIHLVTHLSIHLHTYIPESGMRSRAQQKACRLPCEKPRNTHVSVPADARIHRNTFADTWCTTLSFSLSLQ